MCLLHTTMCLLRKSMCPTALCCVCSANHAGGKGSFLVFFKYSMCIRRCSLLPMQLMHSIDGDTMTTITFFLTPIQRRYFLRSSDCHMYFLSGKRSGILMRRKSWMHFSSSCAGVIFCLCAFLFAASRSRTPKVLTRSMSVLRRISA